jgi:ribosome recycling factor
MIIISPFDTSNAAPIRTAILKANLNLQPIQDGNIVRINVPPMDEALRKDMVKQAKKQSEECKVVIRNIRRDSNDTVKKQKGQGDASEDDVKKLEKEVQNLTDKFCKEVDGLASLKEKEIMTI